MKRLFFLCVPLFMLTVFSSCGTDTPRPGEAAKTYMEYLKNGEYEKFVDGLEFEDSENTKEQRDMSVALLKEKGQDMFKENDGLSSIAVASEVISEDGNTAKVTLILTFVNGKTEDSNIDMVKKDGVWKMKNQK